MNQNQPSTLYVVYRAGHDSMERYLSFKVEQEAIECAKRLREHGAVGTIYVAMEVFSVVASDF